MVTQMLKIMKHIGLLLLIGMVIATGMRVAEWLIPKPETRVVVCFANEIGQVEICKNLEKMLMRDKNRKHVVT